MLSIWEGWSYLSYSSLCSLFTWYIRKILYVKRIAGGMRYSSKSIWALGERTIETEGKSCRDKKAEATVTGGKSHHGVRRGHYVIFFIRRGWKSQRGSVKAGFPQRGQSKEVPPKGVVWKGVLPKRGLLRRGPFNWSKLSINKDQSRLVPTRRGQAKRVSQRGLSISRSRPTKKGIVDWMFAQSLLQEGHTQ